MTQKEITGTCSITATFSPDADGVEQLENCDIGLQFKIAGLDKLIHTLPINIDERGLAIIEEIFAAVDREAAQQAEQDAAEDIANDWHSGWESHEYGDK